MENDTWYWGFLKSKKLKENLNLSQLNIFNYTVFNLTWDDLSTKDEKWLPMLATLVFLSSMLLKLSSLLAWREKLRRLPWGAPDTPTLWLRVWNCDLRADWLLCLLLLDGLCGWVWSGWVKEGWNMEREWTRDDLSVDMLGCWSV